MKNVSFVLHLLIILTVNNLYAQVITEEPEPRVFATIGFLNGGGALVGMDLEIKVAQGLGLQVGAGAVAYGAGINFHLKPTMRSSFFALQYWHQGFGQTFVQSIIGPSFVYRGKKWFTAQLGIGKILEKSKFSKPPVLLYSIGFYYPIKPENM